MNLRAYAQLVRLPNVFTAIADISLGGLVAGSLPSHWLPFVLLALASACLYSAGMVWNDFFDLEQDRKERPARPLPSGRVSRSAAAGFGAALLLGGVIFSMLAGWSLAGSREDGSSFNGTPLVLALLLIVAILLYDGWLKRTWAGLLGMGLSRFLNVLLGLSAGGSIAGPLGLHLAAIVGIYIVGVTWFARTEARMSRQAALAAAAVIMLVALILALPLPLRFEPGTSSVLFPYLLVILAFLVGIPVCQAIVAPTPPHVQSAVKRSIMGLVFLDAVLATA